MSQPQTNLIVKIPVTDNRLQVVLALRKLAQVIEAHSIEDIFGDQPGGAGVYPITVLDARVVGEARTEQ